MDKRKIVTREQFCVPIKFLLGYRVEQWVLLVLQSMLGKIGALKSEVERLRGERDRAVELVVDVTNEQESFQRVCKGCESKLACFGKDDECKAAILAHVKAGEKT